MCDYIPFASEIMVCVRECARVFTIVASSKSSASTHSIISIERGRAISFFYNPVKKAWLHNRRWRGIPIILLQFAPTRSQRKQIPFCDVFVQCDHL